MRVKLAIAPNAIQSRVWLDEVEITKALQGVEVRAFVNEASLIVLTLSAKEVEITGDVGKVLKVVPDRVKPNP